MNQIDMNQIDDDLPPKKFKKIVWTISILLICLLSFFLVPSLLSEPPEKLLFKANTAYKRGKTQEALNYIQHVEPAGNVESIECESLKGKVFVLLGQAATPLVRLFGLKSVTRYEPDN